MALTSSRIHYNQPARAWTEAMPLGNGRLGVMAFFGVKRERLALNEDTLWSGYPKPPTVKSPITALDEARSALDIGEYKRAQRVIERDFTSDYSQAYMPLGDILIEFEGEDDARDYERSLDMASGVARASYTRAGARERRECFVSAPDQLIVYRAQTDAARGLSARVRFNCPLRHTLDAGASSITIEGECPGHARPAYVNDPDALRYYTEPEKRGVMFKAIARVMLTGGDARAEDGSVVITGARELEIRVCARTSFAGSSKHPFTEGVEYARACERDIISAEGREYSKLLSAHAEDFNSLYSRVNFSLDKSNADDAPTDERLLRLPDMPSDPVLYELAFNFGRYLMISASRPGTRAMNLQGIWNESTQPPWSSNYTININTQMNYWISESCALGETHAPLFELIEALRHTGRETARKFYGAGGVVSHHNTDIWGMSHPVGEGREGCAVYAYWQMSYGWLCRHMYEHYLYTLDAAFLKDRALPALKDAARFYIDILRPVNGRLAISPATSPENSFMYSGERVSVARTSTMCDSIVREVFESVLEAQRALGEADELTREIEIALKKLKPFSTGSKGQLLEWDGEYTECEPRHRHTSHLYALHPSHQITPARTPNLARACERTLELRGDDGTGWALGWKVNFWARLSRGDHAMKLMRNQLRFVPSTPGERTNYAGGGGVYLNLFDAHPPFQIDGNFALTSGVVEMLMRSEPDAIYLLPALPREWAKGEITGLRAMNAARVSVWFENGALKRAIIACEKAPARPVSVIYNNAVLLRIERAGEYELKGEDYTCC